MIWIRIIFLPLVLLLLRPASAQPEGSAGSITTTSTKGWSRTQSLNNLGLPTGSALSGSALSGSGIPDSGLTPVWRTDGSLASVELIIGGESRTAAFRPDGPLAGLIPPAAATSSAATPSPTALMCVDSV